MTTPPKIAEALAALSDDPNVRFVAQMTRAQIRATHARHIAALESKP